ncbi:MULTISPECIES: PTS ascorbate transporter subunit IIC [Terrabacteria group]|uniref:PTS ascorbate transporter subunit IIC n=1 Tax=Bacillati TaxID=1783272 RepID=UPI001939BCAF|nr:MULTISPECIES: PTS ascorbate transporter subunit IIC [Terrabacteria group]MBW9212911.1 PTS ascorbate transporter subunit IIC [Trueperella sp. zg.1013]QRG86972.1 PTS ascorbate transporter subunit IIC [Bulleidia sp. zg-1006]
MSFLTDNILRNPPILLALIALIGLVLQKKSISDSIKGTLTVAFGMVILTEGVNILVGQIVPINQAVQSRLGVVVADGLTDVTFTANYGGIVGISMFLGLLIHLLIARFTPIKTIFLTGHMLWWFPFIFVAISVESGLSNTATIILSAFLSACYWSFMPWIMRKFVWDVVGDDSFLIGHPTGILSLISGVAAKMFGDKSKSTESINIPKNLSFFREISITSGLVLFLMYIITAIISPGFVPKGSNIIMFALNAGIKFGAGLLVMLYGVRLLINQIIPAFQGIAEKLVPNAKPAFDIPILFNYKPNAVLIGFLVAMITSTILIIFVNTSHVFGVMLVPLVITSFFECGGAAVIGEGQGGLRGAIIGTAVASLAMVLLVGISAVIYSTTIQNWMLVFGGNDLSLMGILGKLVSQLFRGF